MLSIVEQFLLLMKLRLSIISFVNHAFYIVSKKSSPYPKASRFDPMLYSRNFTVFHLTLKSVIHSEFIFVKSCKVCVKI